MAQYKGFVFDGINSADYGVVITGASTYSAPERAVEMFDIPGRNGALAIDQGRFANIEITYHCAMADRDQATFAQRLSALRNQLCSRYSYVRLTDDYNADEYRLALYKSGLDADLVIDRGGEFDVVFDCKPQRFLTSGESTYQIGEWGQTITETGDIVTYQGDDLTAVKSLTTDLEPIQDLHGYDSPWVGGAGKNKFDIAKFGERAGVTVSSNTFIGTARSFTADSYVESFTAPTGSVLTVSCTAKSNGVVTSGAGFALVFVYDDNTTLRPWYTNNSETTDTYHTGTVTATRDIIGYRFVDYNNGTENTWTVKDFQIEFGSTATSYAPYSNICPIYGRTGQTVTVTGKNMFQTTATSKTQSGVTWDVAEDGSVTVTGTATGYTDLMVGTAKVNSRLGVVTISGLRGMSNIVWNNIVLRDASGTVLYTVANGGSTPSYTVDLSEYSTVDNIQIGIKRSNSGAVSGTFKPQVELGTTATAWEPYAGTTYTRSFVDSQGNELTVYGGEDEIVGGVLTVTHGTYTYGENPITGNPTTSGTGVRANVIAPTGDINRGKWSVQADAKPIFDRYGGTISKGYSANEYTLFFDSVFTRAELDALFAGAQIVYTLATPLTYQLTANEVETLIGTNHVWSDAGEVTVEYGTDPYTMVNDTPFPSKPLIRVTGYGEIGFGDITITITGTAGVVTYIDCDLMECYRMSGGAIVPANQYVTFTGTDFPTIPTGKTRVTSASTVSKVEVVPRWWII